MNTIDRVIAVHDAGYQRRKQWPELFNLDRWRRSASYQIITTYCKHSDAIIEIGCLTGHHLLLLAHDGYHDLTGVDFCKEAIQWAVEHDKQCKINFYHGAFPNVTIHRVDLHFDKIILFDVLEHVHNLNGFLDGVVELMHAGSEVLVMVPLGVHYRDEGHVNFYPDVEALTSLLQYYFKVEEAQIVDNHTKIFAVCRRPK